MKPIPKAIDRSAIDYYYKPASYHKKANALKHKRIKQHNTLNKYIG